jgi:electron transfer flavoprotein alpha subunit
MKKILIVAEHKKGQLKKATMELLGAAKGLEVQAIVFGSTAQPAAEELKKKVFSWTL